MEAALARQQIPIIPVELQTDPFLDMFRCPSRSRGEWLPIEYIRPLPFSAIEVLLPNLTGMGSYRIKQALGDDLCSEFLLWAASFPKPMLRAAEDSPMELVFLPPSDEGQWIFRCEVPDDYLYQRSSEEAMYCLRALRAALLTATESELGRRDCNRRTELQAWMKQCPAI
jgi:hypothetical protein